MEAMERKLEDVWLGDVKLKVNRARLDQEEKDPIQSSTAPVVVMVAGGSKAQEKGGAKVQEGTSYRNAVSLVRQAMIRPENCMVVHPSAARLEELETCFVGALSFVRKANEVQHSLLIEGIYNFRVTSMGDDLVLLQAEVPGVIENAREDHKEWWKATFKDVQRWLPQRVAKGRRVWLRIAGIPLHVWDEPFFKLLASRFGVFLDFDEDTVVVRHLDLARILDRTQRMHVINEQVNISVMRTVFQLWVVEEGWPEERGRVEVERFSDGESSATSLCDAEVIGGVLGGGLVVESDASPNSIRSVGLEERPICPRVSLAKSNLMQIRQKERVRTSLQREKEGVTTLGVVVSNTPVGGGHVVLIGENRDVLIGELRKELSKPFLVVSNTEMQGAGGITLIKAEVAGESQLGSGAGQLGRAVIGLQTEPGQNVEVLNVSDGENSGTRPDQHFSAHLEGESLGRKEGKMIAN